MKREIKTEQAPQAIGPYSQGIATKCLVFVSGQIPVDPVTGLVENDIYLATKLVLKNIEGVLSAEGLTMNDVAKTTVFMTNLGDFAKMNEAYESVFSAPYPARSTVGVCALPKGVFVEIECIAVKNQNKEDK